MTCAAQRLAVNTPGRMQSHPVHRALAHPHCPLQALAPEDLDQTMCDVLSEDEQRRLAGVDEAAFRLHLQFVRAHGLPRGELTTFTTTATMADGVGHARSGGGGRGE